MSRRASDHVALDYCDGLTIRFVKLPRPAANRLLGFSEEPAMPMTAKGKKVMSAMKKQYGAKHGEEVFYASKNKGTISGVDRESKPRKGKKRGY